MHDAAPPLRPGGQQFAVGGQAAQDVLGQLGPVHPDDQLPVPGGLAERADVSPYVLLARPGAQRGRVHAERVHGHLGHVPPVADPPDRAVAVARPVHLSAEDHLAAIQERRGPSPGVKAGLVRAENAVKQRPAHLVGQQPVVVGRRPRGVMEVPDAGVAGGLAEPVPQQPRGQAEVIVLDQDPHAGAPRFGRPGHRRKPRCRPGSTPSRPGTGGRTSAGSACRTAGGAGTTGSSWPRCCTRGRRPRARCRASAPARRPGPRRPRPARGRAVRVAERGADPGHVGLGRDGRQPRDHPGDHAAAAALPGQRAVGAELVGNRTAVGRHQHALLHTRRQATREVRRSHGHIPMLSRW